MSLMEEKRRYGEALISLIFDGNMVCYAKAKNIPQIFGGEKVCAKMKVQT